MNRLYVVLLTLLCVSLFGATAWSQAPDSAVGDYGSVATGNWSSAATWKIFSASGHAFDSTAPGAPGSSSNVFIRTGTTVTYDNNNQNCKSLIVQAGATFQSNATLPTGTMVIKINGPTVWVDGNLGSGPTDALALETKYNGTITLSGSGAVNIAQVRQNSSQGNPMAFTFAMNANLNYAGSAAGSSAAGIQLASRSASALTATWTINSGVTVTLAANSDVRTASSSTSNGTFSNVTFNVNGTLNAPSSSVVLADTAPCAMNIGTTGVVNIGNKLTPYLAGGRVATITVASGGQLNMLSGSTADFTNPSAVVTGAGSFALQSGATIKIGGSVGLDAASGPIQTTTATFDPGANYSYLGTGVQQLGAQLPGVVNNLTIGSTSIDTVTSPRTVNGVLQIDGWLVNGGGLTSAGTATVNGTYQHNDTSAVIPVATWNTGSTCLVSRMKPDATANGGIPNASQNYYNLKVDFAPDMSGNFRLGLAGDTIRGNLIVHNTNRLIGGTSPAVYLAPKYGLANITVMGDLLLDSTSAAMGFGYGSTNDTIILSVKGNIASKGVINCSNSGSANRFFVYGNFAIQDTNMNAFKGHSNTSFPDSLVFCGTGVQKFTKSPLPATMSNWRWLVKNGSSLYFDDTTVVPIGGGAGSFAVEAGGTVKFGHPSGVNGNLTGTAPVFGTGANLEFNGGSAQHTGTRLPLAVNNLTISNSNGVTLDTSTAVSGTLALASGALSIGAYTLSIDGAVSQTGGSLTGGPTSNISIGGTGSGLTLPASVGSLNALTLNNANGATLGGSLTLHGALTFTSGKLNTAAHTLTIDTSGSVSGAGSGKYVYGNLARTYLTGAQTFTYAVGDASIYAPVALSFKNVSTSGSVTAKTTAGDHPNIGASGIDASKSVNRYWSLANGGLGFDTCSADFTFDPSDVDGAANTNNFLVKKYDSGVWSSPVTGLKTATSTQATGLTSMSDFAVGEAAPPTISVTGTLADFGLTAVGDHSAEQSYSVAGANLQGDILITAPADFEVSTTSGSGFGPSVTLTQSGGMVSSTTIYLRFSPGSTGAKSANIAHASTNAVTVDKAVGGTGISAEPTTQASAVHFTNVTPISFTVNWTNGNGSNRIVLAKLGIAVDADPSDSTSYTADGAFGSGSQLGSGNYVVYSGPGNSVNVTGLNVGATYHFAVYEFNGSGGTQNYLLPGATGNQMTAHLVMVTNGTGGGDWSSASTWLSGVVPGPFDSVVIGGTDSVSVASGTTVQALFVQSGGKLSLSANFVATNVTLDGRIVVAAGTLTPTAMAVSGTLSLAGGTVAVASDAHLNILSGGTADFAYPTSAVTGAGSFALQAGATMNIGASAGLDAASGPVQTTTATFDAAANYGYVGTGVQQLGALLPDSVNNLTIGSNSIDTVRAPKKVKGVLRIDGWLVNSGGLTSAGSATVNGTYQHNDTSAAVAMPIATWNTGSTCLVSRLSGTATGGIINGSQNFYHYKVDLDPITLSNSRLGLAGDTIRGDMIIHNTNAPPDTTLNQVVLAPKTKNAAITVLGDLVIDSSGYLSISYGSGADTVALSVKGNIIDKGILYFNGSGVQNRLFVYGNFTIQSRNQSALRGHSNSNQPDSVIFCGSGVQRFTKPTTIVGGSNVRFTVRSGSTLYLDDTTTVNYGGSSPGSFTLASGATLKSGHPGGLNGSLVPYGGQGAGAPTLSTGASYEFNGASAQVTGAWLPSSVNDLTINNTNGVTLSGSVQVNGTLALASGKLTTGANVAAIGTSGSLSGASAAKYVDGSLKKTMNSGTDSKTLEIGDATSYTPVTISGTSYAAPFEVTAKTTAGEYPDSIHFPIIAAKSVNRYFTITGTPTGPSNVTFNFVAGDIDAGANPTSFIVGQHDTTRWAVATVTGNTATTATVAVTDFSDFVIGEAGAVSIGGNVTDGTNPMQNLTITASGGFSGSAQTDLNGTYSFPGVPLGATGVVLTPWKPGYTFSPASRTLTSVSDYLTALDFTGTIARYAVNVNVVGSGTVTMAPTESVYVYLTPVVLQAVPARGWVFQGWSAGSPGPNNTDTVVVDTAKEITATFTIDSTYLKQYRTLTVGSITAAVDNKGKTGKLVKAKPDKVFFSFDMPPAPNHVPVLVKLSIASTGVAVVQHDSTWDSVDTVATFTASKAVTTVPIDSGEVVRVTGIGAKGSPIKVSYVWSTVPRVTKGTVTVFNNMRLGLPMPNEVNALAQVYAGLGTSGIVVGVPHPDLPKLYGWFNALKYTDFYKSLNDGKARQTGTPHPFDILATGKPVLKLNKTLPPTKYNSRLFGNLAVLKFNILASDAGVLPPGLGDLKFNGGALAFVDTTALPYKPGYALDYNGKTLREIAALADTDMMGMQVVTGMVRGKPVYTHFFKSAAYFAAMDSILNKIDSAFVGPVDTTAFSTTLRFTGVGPLLGVSFLIANPSAEPQKITPLATVGAGVPVAYTLYQNYPNPFNPTTTIEFDLPQQSIVSLKIYNILGQEVASLFDRQTMDEGQQQVEFNASRLASGVYFYRLVVDQVVTDEEEGTVTTQSNSFVQVKKMMLVK